MPSLSRNKPAASVIIASLLVVSCAGSAPPLPPDTTSVHRSRPAELGDFSASDAALTCSEIATERESNAAAIKSANERISGGRSQEQTAGFVAAITLPVLMLAAPAVNDADRAEVARRYARQDTLIKLAAFKGCQSDRQ